MRKPGKGQCKVCQKPVDCRELCHTHYEKLRRTGTLEYRIRPSACSRPGCDRKPLAHGLCRNHYMKLERTGTFEYSRVRRNGWTSSDWHRYSRYGVTPEDFRESLEEQENRCAICKETFGPDSRAIHQDHDHKTGNPRGLLCRPCNLALGHLEGRDLPAQWFFEYLSDWEEIYADDEAEEPESAAQEA